MNALVSNLYSENSNIKPSEDEIKRLKSLRQKETEYSNEELEFLYKIHR